MKNSKIWMSLICLMVTVLGCAGSNADLIRENEQLKARDQQRQVEYEKWRKDVLKLQPSTATASATAKPAPAATPKAAAAPAAARPTAPAPATTPVAAPQPVVYAPPPTASVMFGSSPMPYVGHAIAADSVDPNSGSLEWCAPRCLIIHNRSPLPQRVIIRGIPVQLVADPGLFPIPSLNPGWTVVIQMNDGPAPPIHVEYGDPDMYAGVTHPVTHMSCDLPSSLRFPYAAFGQKAPHGYEHPCY
jgi:hypothetical protein